MSSLCSFQCSLCKSVFKEARNKIIICGYIVETSTDRSPKTSTKRGFRNLPDIGAVQQRTRQRTGGTTCSTCSYGNADGGTCAECDCPTAIPTAADTMLFQL